MTLTTEKVHLFDMPWTDDADYEYIFENRLHDIMVPFFAFGDESRFSKEVDFESDYKPVAKIYATFMTEASKYKFMLKYADELSMFRSKRSW